ncbi:hypothetical protein NBRC116598_33300 [Pseudophaeobacter arcticus]|uniref:HTH araC/xylS-type domain-containing protein n=1 Tax=Pseudophaeobacter arcticus TaxID=385492 RepID=A0ABQ0APR9_9RHOB
MAPLQQRQKGFASTGLVTLAIHALRLIDPNILSDQVSAPDPMKGATLDATHKRDLLNKVFETHGAGPLLCIGQHLDLATEYPSMQVLMRSRSPQVLAEKWVRLERYYHAVNRTRIHAEETTLVCKRYGTRQPPAASENLFIAGLVFGLCELAGAQNPRLIIDAQCAEAADLANMKFRSDEDLSSFRVTWQGWPEKASGDPERERDDREGLLPLRLKDLLRKDAARSWRLSDAARLLAKSSRSLQRELAANETSFSSVLRNVRLKTAHEMLLNSQVSLAEIGYCCGYADQAHFQRDFRRVMNMTPAHYRHLASN